MALESEPNEYSVTGVVSTSEGNQEVVFTSEFSGTQQGYSEMSTECIVEDGSGNKQRCVCIKNMDNLSVPPMPTTAGTYQIEVKIENGKPVANWKSV